MKIRRAIIGSTVLFASGCWGATTAKVGTDATSDAVMADTGSNDAVTDGGNCYASPEDPLTLVGTACSWPEHVECNTNGMVVVQCLDSVWSEKSFESDGGEVCYCENSAQDCEPPILTCEFQGVGFLGINVAGWDRQATRSLRLV